jgi:hypothetical protein
VGCRLLISNFGRVIDLSPGGVRVHSGWFGAVAPGTRVELCLTSDAESVTLRARAVRKVRVRGGYETSFEFLGVDPHIRSLLTRMAMAGWKGETIGEEAAERLCADS